MTKPTLCILCSHCEQSQTNGFLQRFTRASSGPAQMRLQFGKSFFNGEKSGE
ncbi:hypothetical protein [Ktedonobacter racemifer]|uniref:hypothetical protein n=1 Tax=Ktedonobacter racemifer TaxID=363277 RepID=UPI0002D43FEF